MNHSETCPGKVERSNAFDQLILHRRPERDNVVYYDCLARVCYDGGYTQNKNK